MLFVNHKRVYYNVLVMDFVKRNVKRIAIEVLGWLLVAVGIAALVLPGPGLLALFAGLALLSTQYEWAERRLIPVKKAALKAAAESVRSPWRVAASVLGALVLACFGVIWILQPAEPGWWFLPGWLWLVGGWGTGITILVSAAIALSMIIYSWFAFRSDES